MATPGLQGLPRTLAEGRRKVETDRLTTAGVIGGEGFVGVSMAMASMFRGL